MKDSEKILIINDDPINQKLLGLICDSHVLEFANDGETALTLTNSFAPDLILIDMTADGYETCRRFKAGQHAQIPVMFLSRANAPEDHFRAFEAGADDYIKTPFDLREFAEKVRRILNNQRQRQRLAQEVQESHQLILVLQDSAAHIQAISRFLQACLFCVDMNALMDLFFQTIHVFRANGVLSIRSSDGTARLRSDSGEPTELERRILEVGVNAGRIYHFGKGRALFNWGELQFLVRNVGDKADIIAILMDGAKTGVRFLEQEALLFDTLARRSAQNERIRQEFKQLIFGMIQVLKDIFFSLSLKTSMSEEEEARINDVVDNFHEHFHGLLAENERNDQEIVHLIQTLRIPEAGAIENGGQALQGAGEADFF